MPPDPPRGTGLMAPCWYSQVFYSNMRATSIIIALVMQMLYFSQFLTSFFGRLGDMSRNARIGENGRNGN